MATQYTTTFYPGGYGKHSLPGPLFKKAYTDTNIAFAQIIKPEQFPKCDFIEIELSSKINFFHYAILYSKDRNGFKDGIASMWFVFDLQPLVTEIFCNDDLRRTAMFHTNFELWEKSEKIMKLFKCTELIVAEDKSRGDADEEEGIGKNSSEIIISYFIDSESSSLVVKVNQNELTDFSGLTLNEVIKSIKLFSGIIKQLVKSFKDEHCPKPTPSKLTFETYK